MQKDAKVGSRTWIVLLGVLLVVLIILSIHYNLLSFGFEREALGKFHDKFRSLQDLPAFCYNFLFFGG